MWAIQSILLIMKHQRSLFCFFPKIGFEFTKVIIIIIYPLTAMVFGAPQMISQSVSSIFPCSPLPSGTWRTPGLSIPWCCLPTSSACLLPPFTVLCKTVLITPDEWDTWPYHCSLHPFRMVRRSSCGRIACWILARTSSLVTWSLYEMCSILRQHLISTACILFWSSAVRVYDSQAYRKMDVTRKRISCILKLRETLLPFQTGFNLVNAAAVCAILESILGLEPSPVITEPRYLKVMIVSSFCPLTLISVLMPMCKMEWVMLASYHR